MRVDDINKFKGQLKSVLQQWGNSKIDEIFPNKPQIKAFAKNGLNNIMARMDTKLNKYVDVLIPRGGAGLIRACVENSTVPVIETGAGNCHLFVDASADTDMAIRVAINAKCSRPSVCNAIETMLVHRDIANEFLPAFKAAVDEKYALEYEPAKNGDIANIVISPAGDATDGAESSYRTACGWGLAYHRG